MHGAHLKVHRVPLVESDDFNVQSFSVISVVFSRKIFHDELLDRVTFFTYNDDSPYNKKQRISQYNHTITLTTTKTPYISSCMTFT